MQNTTSARRRAYNERERSAFRLTNLFDQVSSATRGYELEVVEDAAAHAGRSFNPARPVVPLELLTRDMTAAGVSGSQYVVGAESMAPADVLRPYSVAVRAGVTVLPGLRSNITIPRVTTAASAEWLAGELDPLSGSQPALGDVGMTPKICGSLTTYTKQLRVQQDQLEAFLRSHLLMTIGRAVDVAMIGGSGSAGEPLGIVGTSGVGAESGTSLGWAGIIAMQQAVADAGSEPTAVVATPAVRKLLQGREKAAGSGLVWDGATVGGIAAFATAACPAGTLVVADWTQAVLGIWGDGPEIALDEFTGWASGKITMRVLLSVDTALLHPASFSVSTGVT